MTFFGLSGLYHQALYAYVASVQEQGLDDGQIVQIMMAINEGEITAAKEALKKKLTPSVESYANYLLQQHQQNQEELLALTKQLQLEPQDSPVSQTVETSGKGDLRDLEALQGPAFDKAYVDTMVKEHQGGLNVIESKLIPQAKNAQLKSFVEKFRTMVSLHLQKGKELQKDFNG